MNSCFEYEILEKPRKCIYSSSCQYVTSLARIRDACQPNTEVTLLNHIAFYITEVKFTPIQESDHSNKVVLMDILLEVAVGAGLSAVPIYIFTVAISSLSISHMHSSSHSDPSLTKANPERINSRCV